MVIVGPSHVNALGVVRSLGEMGVKPLFLQLRRETNFVRSSKYLSGSDVVDSAEEIVPYLIEMGRRSESKSLLIPTSDQVSDIVSHAYEKLSSYYFLPHSIDGVRLGEKMDKLWQHDLANRCGLQTPRTWVISQTNQDAVNKITYPCITKSRSSLEGGKTNTHICASRTELDKALLNATDKVIVQEQIQRKTEVDLLGYVDDSGKIWMPSGYYYLNLKKDSYGTQMIHDSVEHISDRYGIDISVVQDFIRATGYRCGYFSVEFLIDKYGNAFFTEINLRNDAHTYGATQLGANIHYGLYAASYKVKTHKFHIEHPVKVIADQQDIFDNVYRRKMSLWHWIREVKQFDVCILCNKKDLMPSLRYGWDIVVYKLFSHS